MVYSVKCKNMKIVVTGDFCPRERVAKDFAQGDYRAIDALTPIFAQADYSIVNLECPIVRGGEKPIIKNGPNLHADTRALDALKGISTSCVTLANNHFRDFGDEGVLNTLSELSAYGIDYVGGGANATDAAAVLYKKICKETLAIVNCCEHESSIATADHCGSNPLNPIQQYYAIQEAKKKGDYVLVIVHGGVEHYQMPTPGMQEMYRFFIDAGADAVVNHHQHCYSGYEIYRGKPIFYGLGNLCFDRSDKRNSIWNEGFLLELSFGKGLVDEGMKGLMETSFRLIPYHQCDAEAMVVMCDEAEQKEFEDRIAELNAIIAKPEVLLAKYQKLLDETRMKYRGHLEPYKTRIARYLFRKGWLPSIMKKKYAVITNVVECESHRERLIDALKV